MSKEAQVVYVVDDDEALCESVRWLLDSVGIESQAFYEVQSFLDGYDAERPSCLVLDVRMPNVGGFQLQEILVARESPMPIIFVSAHGDIRMSVRALQSGAVNFLEKPYDPQILLETVQDSLRRSTELFARDAQRRDVIRRVSSLTLREREILQLVIEGLPSQNIARRLGMSVKTVDVHRARIKSKTEAESIATIVRDVLAFGIVVGDLHAK